MKRRYCRLDSQEKKGKVNKVNKDHYPFDGLGFVNLLYHKLINVPKVKEIIQYLGKCGLEPTTSWSELDSSKSLYHRGQS